MMKRFWILLFAAAVVLSLSGLAAARAAFPAGQGKGKSAAHSKKAEQKESKAAEKGKPEEKGIEHAEQTANQQGVTHGIEKAEAKQESHEGKAGVEQEHASKGKGKAKAKAKGQEKH